MSSQPLPARIQKWLRRTIKGSTFDSFLILRLPSLLTMASQRVSADLMLDIADHCDRATLSTLMQTNKGIKELISGKERSIVIAKLKMFLMPPLGEVLSSEDERRCRIVGKYSFATIQELDLRERRMVSILENSGFLLTDDGKKLGLPGCSLVKFKAGLKRALYMADRFSDLETQPEVLHVQDQLIRRLCSLQSGSGSIGSVIDEIDLDKIEAFGEEAQAQHSAITVHRNLQFEMIRGLETIDIAWLLTLGEGAMKGCTRYYERMFESDPAGTHYKVVAFKEELLRKGSFMLWAFVRGGGPLAAFAKTSMRQTGEEIMGFEIGHHHNCGLSSMLHQEMRRRVLVELQRRDPLLIDEEDDEDGWDELPPSRVMEEAHRMIGKQIGCQSWCGYSSIVYPPVE
ncbi:hypothetical protein KVR01_000311 [Diaporthe batatas]|uniref:uncharacterized protein n=1 Tax=Diaporthe batatas TaxID=748121 RepID=UPI001D04BB91|nr:uncharacterized protein KVR01_000311 [Diaporthe batatas]KAG8169566.1 hypothetical protein KVR01_000311 [Diaporthe batatas]